MKIYIIILLVIQNLITNAQAGLDQFARNELKYWKLRGRFIGDENNKDVYNGFVQVGSRMGTSKKLSI